MGSSKTVTQFWIEPFGSDQTATWNLKCLIGLGTCSGFHQNFFRLWNRVQVNLLVFMSVSVWFIFSCWDLKILHPKFHVLMRPSILKTRDTWQRIIPVPPVLKNGRTSKLKKDLEVIHSVMCFKDEHVQRIKFQTVELVKSSLKSLGKLLIYFGPCYSLLVPFWHHATFDVFSVQSCSFHQRSICQMFCVEMTEHRAFFGKEKFTLPSRLCCF